MKYELLENSRFKVTNTGDNNFKTSGVMSMAGKEFPFPEQQLPKSFGEDGTVWAYSCTGDQLVLTAEIAGIKNLTYPMTRIE